MCTVQSVKELDKACHKMQYDCSLLPEQEMPLLIAKTWFLDQEIPAGGFFRIQNSSQVWEQRVDEIRIITKKCHSIL